MAEALDVSQTSNPNAAVLLAAFTASAGGTVTNTNINVKSIRVLREKHRAAAATEKRITVHKTCDEVLTVHWDGKVILVLIGDGTTDRQAIIVTGETTCEFLGAPTVPNGTAESIKVVVLGTLVKYMLVKRVRAMSFDTTPTNSGNDDMHLHRTCLCVNKQRVHYLIYLHTFQIPGRRGGAATLIEQELGEELIWLPCRRHVYERVLYDVFHLIMGPTTGRDVTIFNEFQQVWPSLDKKKYSTFADFAVSKRHLSDCVDEIIAFATEQIKVL